MSWVGTISRSEPIASLNGRKRSISPNDQRNPVRYRTQICPSNPLICDSTACYAVPFPSYTPSSALCVYIMPLFWGSPARFFTSVVSQLAYWVATSSKFPPLLPRCSSHLHFGCLSYPVWCVLRICTFNFRQSSGRSIICVANWWVSSARTYTKQHISPRPTPLHHNKSTMETILN